MAKVRETTLDEYRQDPENANAGTQAGQAMLDRSFAEVGAVRSLAADAEGVLIAGNKSQLAAQNAGIEKVIEVTTDGTELVIVRREDMLPGDPRREAAAIYDNRVGDLRQWDSDKLKKKWAAGLDAARFGWNPERIQEQIKQAIEHRKAEIADSPLAGTAGVSPEPEPGDNGNEPFDESEIGDAARDHREYHFTFDLTFDDSILVDRACKEWELTTGKPRSDWLVEMAGVYLRDKEETPV